MSTTHNDEHSVNHAQIDQPGLNNGMHTQQQQHDFSHWGQTGHITPVYTGGSTGDYPIPPAPYYPFSTHTGYGAQDPSHTWGYPTHYQTHNFELAPPQHAPQNGGAAPGAGHFGPPAGGIGPGIGLPPPQGVPQGVPQGYNNFFDSSYNPWTPNIITHTATDARGLKTAEYYQPRSVYGVESYTSTADLSRGMATLSIGGTSAALQVNDGHHMTMGGFGSVIPAPQAPPMPAGPPKALSWADKVKQPPKPADLKAKRGPIGGTGGRGQLGVPAGKDSVPPPIQIPTNQGLWNGPAPPPLPRPAGPRGDTWGNNHIQPTIRRPGPGVAGHGSAVNGAVNGSGSGGTRSGDEPESAVLQQLKRDTNPLEIQMNLKAARFFVIKSYSEDDVHRSIKYGIWCSTEHGNTRLDAAYKNKKGPIYLFYSVNASGHFCGIAEMISAVDSSKQSSVWAQAKWKGLFKVKWLYVKDVPNGQLRHIRLENNENKPVTNSRDTQEMAADKGRQVLKLIHAYKHTTSLFDDFAHYEKRQLEEQDTKKRQDAPHKGGYKERQYE